MLVPIVVKPWFALRIWESVLCYFLVWFGRVGEGGIACGFLRDKRSKWSWGIYIRTTLWSCVVEVGVENVDAKLAPNFGELTSRSCVSICV
jgi:hypothetical protein